MFSIVRIKPNTAIPEMFIGSGGISSSCAAAIIIWCLYPARQIKLRIGTRDKSAHIPVRINESFCWKGTVNGAKKSSAYRFWAVGSFMLDSNVSYNSNVSFLSSIVRIFSSKHKLIQREGFRQNSIPQQSIRLFMSYILVQKSDFIEKSSTYHAKWENACCFGYCSLVQTRSR